MKLLQGKEFANRAEIGELFGCSHQHGITLAKKTKAVLLLKNEKELYSDYFYPKGSYNYCMYTLLLFEKRKGKYYFVGEYILTETHQNIQPDDKNFLRRVFVFHLKKTSNTATVSMGD